VNPSYVRALDVPGVRNFINSTLNGNYVSPMTHALTDPFRSLSGMTAADNLNPLLQQALRVPAWLDGSAAGSAVGGANSVANGGCGCQ